MGKRICFLFACLLAVGCTTTQPVKTEVITPTLPVAETNVKTVQADVGAALPAVQSIKNSASDAVDSPAATVVALKRVLKSILISSVEGEVHLGRANVTLPIIASGIVKAQTEATATAQGLADEKEGRKSDNAAWQKKYDNLKTMQDSFARYAMAVSFGLMAVAIVWFFGARIAPLTGTTSIVILSILSLGAAGTGYALGWSASLPVLAAGKVAAYLIMGLGGLAFIVILWWTIKAALANGAVNPVSDVTNNLAEAFKYAVAPASAVKQAANVWDENHPAPPVLATP